MNTIKGKVWVFGDHIDTDLIVPARYLVTSDEAELGKHFMEDWDPEFVNKIAPGDVLVGGDNFGCGSSREHAPVAIKGAGISCVIAKSYARIFYRNSINVGLPIFVCPEAVDAIEQGDTVSVDIRAGVITDETKGRSWTVPPFPETLQKIIAAGGLVNYVAAQMENTGR